jgi:cytochrome d ubiquinol oxidase subunit I
LLFQPVVGFFNVLVLELSVPGASGPYDRLVGAGGESTLTSHLLWINLAMVVGLFVLSNVAMYLGAERHPERAGRVPIRFFGLLAALAGLYSISPIADWPFLYMRYIMIAVMVLATLGALVTYVRGRGRFRYGSPSGWHRAALLALGVLAAVVTLNMGFMKSNSRAPYTIYGDNSYRVQSEKPISPGDLRPENPQEP